MPKLYTDELGRNVCDVTQELIGLQLCMWGGKNSDKLIVKAERRETETLILTKRAGGHWWITNWTHKTKYDDITEVRCTDETKFSRRDINPNESLFKQIRLWL